MDEQIRQLLLAADDPEHFEMPQGQQAYKDYADVLALGPELDQVLGQPVKFSPFEETSFSGSYEILVRAPPPDNYTKTPIMMEAIIRITFSNFGRFFNVGSNARK